MYFDPKMEHEFWDSVYELLELPNDDGNDVAANGLGHASDDAFIHALGSVDGGSVFASWLVPSSTSFLVPESLIS